MGLFSASVSIMRYRVEGHMPEPILEKVTDCLNKNVIREIDEATSNKAVGWTSFERPYDPYFDDSSFAIGQYWVFAMRIDKKTIPPKVVKKHFETASAKRLSESGLRYLTKEEKRTIREQVEDSLSLRIPASPSIFDVVWNYDEGNVWLFSGQKAANEEFETLFVRSFDLSLIRLFPFTMAELNSGLSPNERDMLKNLTPSRFTE